MKNDIKTLAFSLLLFIIILSVSFYAKKYLATTTDFMLTEIQTVESYISQNQWDKAYDSIDKLSTEWEKIEVYCTLIINHHEIDNITVSLVRANECIKTKNMIESQIHISSLKHYISHIPEMEELSWENIF